MALRNRKVSESFEKRVPGLNANEIQISYDTVASRSVLIGKKSPKHTHNSVKYEVV